MQTLRKTFQWLAQRKSCSGFARPVKDVQRSRQGGRVSRCQGPQRHVARVERQVKAAAAGCEADGLGESGPDCRGYNKRDQAAPDSGPDGFYWQAFIEPVIGPPSPLAGYDELDFPENWTITVPYDISESDSDSSSQTSSSSNSPDSSSSSSTTAGIPSTSDCSSEASCSNQLSSNVQSFDRDLLNELISKVRCSGSEDQDLHSAAAGSRTATNSLDASDGLRQWPVANQLLPAADFGGTELKITRGPLRNLSEVYVLLFGHQDRQGIYSLRSFDNDELPVDTIIAFESVVDAFRYATSLEPIMSQAPHVCSMPIALLTSFCTESGYSCKVELEGSSLRPPEDSVLLTDWERGMRLKDDDFMELIEEPEVMGHQDARELTEWEVISLKAYFEGLLSKAPSSEDGL